MRLIGNHVMTKNLQPSKHWWRMRVIKVAHVFFSHDHDHQNLHVVIKKFLDICWINCN